MAKLISLTQGKHTAVDNADFDWLSQWRWHFYKRYVARRDKTQNYKYIYMHRLLMNAPPGKEVDHINNDPLDNRKRNLRLCSRAQNLQNARRRSDNKSGFKGVHWDDKRSKWLAQIVNNGKYVFIGRFEDKNSAAREYNNAARRYFGEFAKENCI